VAIMAMSLGVNHKKYKSVGFGDDLDQIIREDEKQVSTSLLSLCSRYGIQHKFFSEKELLQGSFVVMKDGALFTQRQIKYAAEDAISSAKLYFSMADDIQKRGLNRCLFDIEFPYALSNAECEWNGICISREKGNAALIAANKACDYYREGLEKYGIENPLSQNQVYGALERLQLSSLFKSKSTKSGYSFKSDVLKYYRVHHPVIDLLYKYKKYRQVSSSKLLEGEFLSIDGRVHPNWQHLGADTGRTQPKSPPASSIGKVLRPIVIPGPGNGIGEVDLSQIEMGLAAAMSSCSTMIDDYNSGDIYVSGAKKVFASELSVEKFNFTIDEFKNSPKTRSLRTKVKPIFLGILYNRKAKSIALDLNIEEYEAQGMINRFFLAYPELKTMLNDFECYGGTRGFATTFYGLRRYRARPGHLTQWERNWLRNMPIQGTAAEVFKKAIVKVTKAYRKFNAKIIAQVHDAIVFECPMETLEEVALITQKILQNCVEDTFPQLIGKADINIIQPHCWNKDGAYDSIEKFFKDPTYRP
jgi:DNA polymerase I